MAAQTRVHKIGIVAFPIDGLITASRLHDTDHCEELNTFNAQKDPGIMLLSHSAALASHCPVR